MKKHFSTKDLILLFFFFFPWWRDNVGVFWFAFLGGVVCLFV